MRKIERDWTEGDVLLRILTCSITILVKAFVVQTQEISFIDCMTVLPATSETGDFVS